MPAYKAGRVKNTREMQLSRLTREVKALQDFNKPGRKEVHFCFLINSGGIECKVEKKTPTEF